MRPTIVRGFNFQGRVFLKESDGCDASNVMPYAIDPLWEVQIRLPGTDAVPVVLSTADGDVTVADGPNGIVDFLAPPAKTALCVLGNNQGLTIIVVKSTTDKDVFDRPKVVDVKDPEQP